MICENYSSRRHLREVCYSLLTIAIGFLSCSIIAALAYYTYQSTAGNISYCSLWTDIPGRLALFLIFYYSAGICGAFPIPECFRVNWLPPPFTIYRRESWTNLLENLNLLFTCNYQGYEALENDPEMSPPRDECNKRDYDSSPTPTFHEESKNTQISETDTPKQSSARSNYATRYSDVESDSSYEDSSMSFSSPTPDQFIQMGKKKSPKPRYISDSRILSSDANSLFVGAQSDESSELSDTSSDSFKASAALCNEDDDPEVDLSLPSYPRMPWSYLKDESGVPYEAKSLHKKNLMIEKQEISEYNKRQKYRNRPPRMSCLSTYGKAEETRCSLEDSKESLIAESDEIGTFVNRSPCSPPIPAETKTGFHNRTVSTPRDIGKSGKMKTKTHRRFRSCSPPHRYRPYETDQMNSEFENDFDFIKEDKCCENSSGFQNNALMKFDQSFRIGASTSRQSTDFPNDLFNSNTLGEASTSRQHICVFPSKISDSNVAVEESTARQNIDFPTNVSNSNTGDESSAFRQNSTEYQNKISDSNIDAEASASRQSTDDFSGEISDSNAVGEASTSEQNTDNFPSKISAGNEVSTSKQNTDDLP